SPSNKSQTVGGLAPDRVCHREMRHLVSVGFFGRRALREVPKIAARSAGRKPQLPARRKRPDPRVRPPTSRLPQLFLGSCGTRLRLPLSPDLPREVGFAGLPLAAGFFAAFAAGLRRAGCAS